ncbi:MAG: hypothetical protein ACOZNI_25950 [Myxococcota bacterium]
MSQPLIVEAPLPVEPVAPAENIALPALGRGPREWLLARVLVPLFVAGFALWPLPKLVGQQIPGDTPKGASVWINVETAGVWPWELVMTRTATAQDVIVTVGYPWLAVLTRPLEWLLGTNGWIAVATWLGLAAVGWGGAWLGGRWWGTPGAALVTGVAWQVAAAPTAAITGGWYDGLVVFALLPVTWGLWVRAIDRDSLPAAIVAGLGWGAILTSRGGGVEWLFLLCLPASALAGAEGRKRAAVVPWFTGIAVGVLVASPILAWAWGDTPKVSAAIVFPDPSTAAWALGLYGAFRSRGVVRRLLAPGLAILGGLLPVDLWLSDNARPMAELGLAVLAGAAVADPRKLDERVATAIAVALLLGVAALRWPFPTITV